MPLVSVGQAAGSTATILQSRLPVDLLLGEGDDEAAEVAAAADAADEDVGLLAQERELLEGLLADDRLVQEDVVEHRAEGVVAVPLLAGRHFLDRLADRDARGLPGWFVSSLSRPRPVLVWSLGEGTTVAPQVFIRMER